MCHRTRKILEKLHFDNGIEDDNVKIGHNPDEAYINAGVLGFFSFFKSSVPSILV